MFRIRIDENLMYDIIFVDYKVIFMYKYYKILKLSILIQREYYLNII